MKWTTGVVVALTLAGCGSPDPKPRTVNDLADDPAVLQGLLARCEADKRAKFNDAECANARRALNRNGIADDTKRQDERDAEFERQRAQLRAKEDAARRAASQAAPKFDPYSSPIASDPPANPPKP